MNSIAKRILFAGTLILSILAWNNGAFAQTSPGAALGGPSFSLGWHAGAGSHEVVGTGGRLGLRLGYVQLGVLAERGVNSAQLFSDVLAGMGLGYSYRGFRLAGMGTCGFFRFDESPGDHSERRPPGDAESGLAIGGWGELTHAWFDDGGAGIELGVFSQYRYNTIRANSRENNMLTFGLLLGLRVE